MGFNSGFEGLMETLHLSRKTDYFKDTSALCNSDRS